MSWGVVGCRGVISSTVLALPGQIPVIPLVINVTSSNFVQIQALDLKVHTGSVSR